jgi:hypothetical protein
MVWKHHNDEVYAPTVVIVIGGDEDLIFASQGGITSTSTRGLQLGSVISFP